MIKETTPLLILKKIYTYTLYDSIHFPVWWYTKGLKRTYLNFLHTVFQGNEILAVSLWFKNMFQPMYGQSDTVGRIISFFIRVIIGIFRLTLFVIWVGLSVSILILWIILPLVAVSQIVYQIGGLF